MVDRQLEMIKTNRTDWAQFGYAVSLLLFMTGFSLAIAVEYFLLQAGRV